MQIQLLKSKIHRAAVTDANVNYEGSITIDRELMDKVSLREYERVLCGNLANGERFETYAIAGEAGSGGDHSQRRHGASRQSGRSPHDYVVR